MTSPRRTLAALPQLVLLGCACGAAVAAAQPDEEGLQIRGVQRTRVEALDPQFRAGLSNSDQVVELQTAVVLDWRRAAWHAAGELLDARSLGNDEGSFASGALVNTLEPIQAYVAWEHNASTLRIGRVTQDLGKRRLIGRNRFRNSINTFTGIDWSWTAEDGRAAHAFYCVTVDRTENLAHGTAFGPSSGGSLCAYPTTDAARPLRREGAGSFPDRWRIFRTKLQNMGKLFRNGS